MYEVNDIRSSLTSIQSKENNLRVGISCHKYHEIRSQIWTQFATKQNMFAIGEQKVTLPILMVIGTTASEIDTLLASKFLNHLFILHCTSVPS